MGKMLRYTIVAAGVLSAALCGFAGSAALAFDNLRFLAPGASEELTAALNDASLLREAKDNGQTDGGEVLAAALSDYRRLTETLYANGFYSGVVNILVDGREAANVPLLSVPDQVGTVEVRIETGPIFTIDKIAIGPVPDGGAQVAGLVQGAPAYSPLIREAVTAAIDGWRAQGYALATVSGQSLKANHAARTLSVDIDIDPGRQVKFGALVQTTDSAVRPNRVQAIAGLPKGEVFDPEDLDTAADRLRRTRAFASVALTETGVVDENGEMDIDLTLVDAAPRRFGAGAELSSIEGLKLTGFWLHRNLLGGAERFRIDGEIAQIGSSVAGTDYKVTARLDRPAAIGPDTSVYVLGEIGRLDEPDFTTDSIAIEVGATRIITDDLTAEAGVSFSYARTSDGLGEREFSLVSLPISGTLDRRDDPLDAHSGYYIGAEITPFLGLGGTASGVRSTVDGRGYLSLGGNDRFVLAGRLQLGSIFGAELTELRPDMLFYTGGSATVRGQPYNSLDVDAGGGLRMGGRSFAAASTELRVGITEAISAVGFYDIGYVGTESFVDGSGDWHAGAGLGLRYDTSLGPIRLDLAAPVSGETGDGLQIYLGIGQAF